MSDDSKIVVIGGTRSGKRIVKLLEMQSELKDVVSKSREYKELIEAIKEAKQVFENLSENQLAASDALKSFKITVVKSLDLKPSKHATARRLRHEARHKKNKQKINSN